MSFYDLYSLEKWMNFTKIIYRVLDYLELFDQSQAFRTRRSHNNSFH